MPHRSPCIIPHDKYIDDSLNKNFSYKLLKLHIFRGFCCFGNLFWNRSGFSLLNFKLHFVLNKMQFQETPANFSPCPQSCLLPPKDPLLKTFWWLYITRSEVLTRPPALSLWPQRLLLCPVPSSSARLSNSSA